MFRIGEFSRIASVTIETLRYYDALGLLKPAQVDPVTGYRYYSPDQLQDLNQILALKEVGLSLDEIARILQEQLTTEELRGMLKAQLAQTESTIEQAQQRRERILIRLNHLNQPEDKPVYEVTLKSTDTFTVAAIREKIPTTEQIPQRWNELFSAIAGWLTARNLPVGFPLALYHDEGYTYENVDTECAFIVPDIALDGLPVPPEPIVIRQMDAIPQVATIVVANFHEETEGLRPAYTALGQWIAEHGDHVMGSPREIYYGLPETGDFTAEIQFPVSKACPQR